MSVMQFSQYLIYLFIHSSIHACMHACIHSFDHSFIQVDNLVGPDGLTHQQRRAQQQLWERQQRQFVTSSQPPRPSAPALAASSGSRRAAQGVAYDEETGQFVVSPGAFQISKMWNKLNFVTVEQVLLCRPLKSVVSIMYLHNCWAVGRGCIAA